MPANKKLFTKDKRSKNPKIKTNLSRKQTNKKTATINPTINMHTYNNKLYSRVNGMKLIRPFTSKQNHIICKLDQYHELESNKKYIGVIQDEEFKEKSVQYVRNKGVSRTEIARRTQAKRIMHARVNKNNHMKNNNNNNAQPES